MTPEKDDDFENLKWILEAHVSGALLAASLGAVYGAGTADEGKRTEGAKQGAVVGGLVGAAAPVAGATLGKVAEAAVPKIEQATATLAKRAEDFGIPLRLDQISPTRVRNTIQKVSQEIPFSGVDAFEKQQRTSWNKAVAKTIGQDADSLSPEVIQSFAADNGQKFDDVLKGQTFNFTNMVKKDLMNIAKDAKSTISDDLVKVVQANVDDVWNQLKYGRISGEKLTSIRSQLVKKMTRAGNASSQYIGDIVDKIDDVVSGQLPQAKTELLQGARREYRNFKTIQPLLEKSTDGTINPTELLNRVSASKYITASKTAVGSDDLVDLARIGKKFLVKKGGSDTTQKVVAVSGATAALTNPLTALAVLPKAAAGVAANRYILQGANTSQRLVKKAVQRGQGPLIGSNPLTELASSSARQAPLKITIRPRKD